MGLLHALTDDESHSRYHIAYDNRLLACFTPTCFDTWRLPLRDTTIATRTSLAYCTPYMILYTILTCIKINVFLAYISSIELRTAEKGLYQTICLSQWPDDAVLQALESSIETYTDKCGARSTTRASCGSSKALIMGLFHIPPRKTIGHLRLQGIRRSLELLSHLSHLLPLYPQLSRLPRLPAVQVKHLFRCSVYIWAGKAVWCCKSS